MANARTHELSAKYRRTALDRLQPVLAAAERDVEARRGELERLAGSGGSAAPARTRLRLAEYRLALLRGSRRWLTSGEPPPGTGAA